MGSIKNNILRTISLLPGWHTSRKLVIIESDDWGSIRTKDKESLNTLGKKFPHILKDPYNKFDRLESNRDLEALFEVLLSVRDKNGNPAVITANTIMANPDFKKIKDAGFKNYYYELFFETYNKYPNSGHVFQLILQGKDSEIFKPQLHGREHLNINQWLNALQRGHAELIAAFELEMFGVQLIEKINMRNNVMAAFDFENPTELSEQAKIITESQELFKNSFGYPSFSLIPPSYIWHQDLESSMVKAGISYIQGLPYQYIPNPEGVWYKKNFRYTGKKTKSGLIHLARNAFFEPSLFQGKDVVGESLSRINLAFKLKKPAIIGSHRLNFIGTIEEKNRTNNLRLLKELLHKIIQRWPEVEFMSSDQLGDIISGN